MQRRRRASDHGEFHADERWLITYADMITLLLAVFIVLYALSDQNVRKFTAFAQSVAAAFSTEVFQGTEAITVTSGQQSAPSTDTFDAGSGVLSTDLRTVEATVRDFAVENGVGGQVSVDRVPEGIAIRISDALLFSSGRASLDARSKRLLDRVIVVVGPLPNRLRIEGHTDDEPPAGPFYTDNWSLSVARALAVLRAMVEGGVDRSRLAAAGYAEFQPIVPMTDDASRARNRRVDVLILYPDTSSQPFAPVSSPQGILP
ncbi:MAG: hypothetical protein C0498_05055 [Anaerolinea sp.]|jgi:chemotaxis protein MotB|nr:hypothetical protein [Anaerolinea sp.]